ncbi:glutamine--fructose-6-phosphate transaminase (isomerizing) [Candidatus Uhrbacteria bacterium]|jgi:glutamine---fructose-6-phosphate transaminase (isomerizing)|nr:glutamine--fructose-6-phosphate transaminase (isomerizing) [Candidatus Uhrbacteria bacterium]
MCGIIGYVGSKQATPILLKGLKALEYRGYDSSGLTVQSDRLVTVRAVGEVSELVERVQHVRTQGTAGIAHTRWATHGIPSVENAHPHADCAGGISVVHNGIIENHIELREELIARGHVFASETDSEVIAHLIEERLSDCRPLFAAVRESLARVRGTYGLVVISKEIPQTLIAARMGSPLVIGVGDGEYFIASDPSAIIEQTKDVIFLDDGELAAVTSEGVSLMSLDAQEIQKETQQLDWDIETATKEGNPHFMLKEILEQPQVIENSCRGRIDLIEGRAVLGGLKEVEDRLREIDRVVIVGCGSAYYAGLVGEYLIEDLAGIPVEVELGSEYRYRKPIITERTVVLAISQSGETADTLEAIREAKRKNALTLGIINTVGSSIARETDAGVYCHAGPEIGVASTKAFVSQLAVLSLVGVYLGQLRGSLSDRNAGATLAALYELPDQVQEILNDRNLVTQTAKKYSSIENCLYLGRSFHAPIAYEGALKLKEVSYVHAEGYSSGEMKHGPIALIDQGFPSIVLCPEDSVFEKNCSNMQELRARRGPLIGITTKGAQIDHLVDARIDIPKTIECLQPILSTIPLQLFAYEMAIARKLNPDKPRNLAKSVTVE